MIQPSIIYALDEAAAERPDHPALEDVNGPVTYRELLQETQRLAGWLRQQGVSRRQRIGIHLPKGREEVVATLAVAGVRAVFVNLNYQWTTAQVEYVAKDCDINVLITDSRRARRLTRSTQKYSRVLVLGTARIDGCTSWEELAPCAEPLESSIGADLAALLYTSGSTGRPKGVMVSHGQLMCGAEIVSTYLGLRQADRILSVPPLSFDYGLNQLTASLHRQATLCLQPTPLPAEIRNSVVKWSISGLPLVAPSWVQLVRLLEESNERLEGVRYLTNTGGAIPDEILEQLPIRFPNAQIFLMYGLTEAFRSTYLPSKLFAAKRGSIGRAIPNVEIFVVDEARGVCGVDEVGELIHRGELISGGYWRRPEETEKRIRVNPHLKPLIGDELVVHSGDLVRRDADGILWFVGRADGMIKTSGHRVSPTEVELGLTQFDEIDEAVAFGVKDDELGQTISVVVSTSDASLDRAELLKKLQGKMPAYMMPKRVFFTAEAFPRTANGKIDRLAVITQYSNQT